MSFTAEVRNGVVTLPPEISLPDGTRVSVATIAPPEDAFLDLVSRTAKPRPHWPADYALNHGHHVSGEPKKS